MVRRRFPRNRRRWLLRLMLALGVSGAGLWLAWEWQSHGGQTNIHADEGKRAPAFTLPSHTGDSVALTSYLGRQPVLLVFYMGDF
jgi:hypothetical protein